MHYFFAPEPLNLTKMLRFLLEKNLLEQRTIKILKSSFLVALLASVCVYACVRIMFFEIRNGIGEEMILLGKVILVALQIGAGISLFFIAITAVEDFAKNPRWPMKMNLLRVGSLVVILTGLLSFPSHAQTLTGVKKDSRSGLVTTYQLLEPSSIEMIMNDEVIRHGDIPLGEKFIIRNKNVKGFTVKNGKVSVGCALLITDEKGKKVLEMADLFKGKDVFKPEDMNNLKCTISTGSPMDWEKMYTVQVTYWDKYGKGRLVNKIRIRMIDIP